jgi:L-fuculose-phosphate aldolase
MPLEPTQQRPDSPPPDDGPEVREAIVAACRRLAALGHFVGTWGNIGVRTGQGLLVTPTRLDYDQLTAADLVLVDWDGQRIAGERLPSSEMELHRQVLAARPDLGAVVHTHSPYATAVAAARRPLPVCVEDMAQIIGGPVQCARYVPGGRHRELGAAACEALHPDSAAVLLANHGAVVGGRDLAEAIVASQVLEKAALAFLFAERLGGAHPVPPHAAAAERDRFLHKYGRPADQPARSP